MSLAVLTCSYPTNTPGGKLVRLSTWQTININNIESQFNTSGGGTNFCTLTSVPVGAFVLTSGRYRINGWAMFRSDPRTTQWKARITNISSGASLAFGSAVSNGTGRPVGTVGCNDQIHLGGEFATDGEKFALQVYSTTTGGLDTQLGAPQNIAGMKECYAYLEIHKIY